jgi:hypothetical protein
MVSRLGRLGGRLGHRGRGRPRRRVKRLPSKLSVAPRCRFSIVTSASGWRPS